MDRHVEELEARVSTTAKDLHVAIPKGGFEREVYPILNPKSETVNGGEFFGR